MAHDFEGAAANPSLTHAIIDEPYQAEIHRQEVSQRIRHQIIAVGFLNAQILHRRPQLQLSGVVRFLVKSRHWRPPQVNAVERNLRRHLAEIERDLAVIVRHVVMDANVRHQRCVAVPVLADLYVVHFHRAEEEPRHVGHQEGVEHDQPDKHGG